jgi:hypothetical protein
MGVQERGPPASVVAFAPKRAGQERAEQQPAEQKRIVPVDDAGNVPRGGRFKRQNF